MRKFHTDGQVCINNPLTCLRWHTETTPRVTGMDGGLFEWPEDTIWVDRHGAKHASGPDDRVVVRKPEPEQPESPRASALNEARDLITGDRNNQYGPPTQDFDRTAKLLNAMGYARIDAEGVVQDILPSDVALIIAQVKVSRLMHSRRKRDSWVDLAGYAACGFECAEEEGKPGAS